MRSIRRYMQFVKPYGKQIVITIIIGMVKFGIPLLIPLLLKFVIDDVIQNNQLTYDEKVKNLLWAFGFMMIIFTIIRPVIEYYRQYYAQWAGTRVLYDIRNHLYEHLQKLSFRYYSNTRAGEIISRVINDVEQTKEFIMTGLMNVWIDSATIIISAIIMFSMDVKLSLVAICTLPLYAISVKYFLSRLRMLTRVRSQALAQLQGFLHERVQGMPIIQSFAIEQEEQKNFDGQNKYFLTRALEHTSWNAKSFSIINTLTDIAPIMVICYAGYLVMNHSLTLGAMVAFIGYLDNLYNPLRRLVNSSTTLTQSFASMDRMYELLDEKYDIQDRKDAIHLENVSGSISFENISFSYNPDEEKIIKNLSLQIEAGKTFAFVGMSGGGKSTLVSLIPRFHDVTEGRILLDGIDIRDIQIQNLRNQMGVVFQESILFSDSIRENILLGKPNATDEEVVAAAKAANAHDFIVNLSDGYDTKVGERGVKLSGGQKQRISIARVFLKNPQVLILDEATSALDLESEQLIQASLKKLATNRTTFIVAHRLSTITHVDQIVLIEHGEIVEQGTHEQLMRKRGAYYRLFTIQEIEVKQNG